LLHFQHGLALAHDVGAVIFPGDLVLERGVLLLERGLSFFYFFVKTQELRNEGGHHAQKFRVGIELLLSREDAVHIHDADGAAVQQDGHADKGYALLADAPRSGLVQKKGFKGDVGDHIWLCRTKDDPGDALVHAIDAALLFQAERP
jgi:hypothetical protein